MSLVCKHCGYIDWASAPRILQIKQLLEKRGAMTSLAIAHAVGISASNSVNQLVKLVALGVVERLPAQPHPSGGVFHEYRIARAA